MEAIWKILQLENPGDFIICSGISTKLRDIVEYVFDRFNIDKKLIIEDKSLFRPNEIWDIYGGNSKAKGILGWHYDYSIYAMLDILMEEEVAFNCNK